MNTSPEQVKSAAQERGRKRVPDVPIKPAAQESAADDFRDHLATADEQGRRKWIYARKPQGRLYQARIYVSWFLLALMFAGPFIRIHGNPLLLLNVVQRKFIVLGQIFWPHDMILFAVALLIFITGILIFTAAFGRLWCGWACPQTVLMEMVFRKIEYLIEGDSHQQRVLAKAPWSAAKLSKKITKHAIFLSLSFLVGNTLLAYIIGTDQLFQIVTDSPARHLHGLAFMILFTGIFYANFARFREQACTFICPYGRFQSTVLDENSIVVAYDYKRGEKRAPLRPDSGSTRKAGGLGDCIDCRQCVNVCPTGIDIRNGTQMECVHCTACIDACDAVMQKIHLPAGLIRYASLNGIERGERLKFTPRLAGYIGVLLALTVFMGFLIFTRSDVQTTLLRAPGALFQKMPDGRLSNLYTVKIINKTSLAIPVQLKLESPKGGELLLMGNQLTVPPQKLTETSLLITLDPATLKSASIPINVGIYSGPRRIESIKTTFIGPRQ